MSKTIRNEFDKQLTYEKLMIAHKLSRKGKGYRKDVILFNLKQEEYIMWLYEKLKTKTYKHGGYTVVYITEPKVRKIEKSKYIDRIVHRWVVDNFLVTYFVPTFISTTYACLKDRGMHKACLDVQKAMLHCKRAWNEYYILKMDISKYFYNLDHKIIKQLIREKIKDKNALKIIDSIIDSTNEKYINETIAKLKENEKLRILNSNNKNKKGCRRCR